QLARRGVTVSAGLLGTVLAHNAVSAAVAGPLVVSTTRAATFVASGKAATAGALAAGVAELVEGATTPMSITPFKVCLALVVTAGLLAGAAVARRGAVSPGEAGLPAADPAPPEAAKKPAGDKVIITGRVLDPPGKPAA